MKKLIIKLTVVLIFVLVFGVVFIDVFVVLRTRGQIVKKSKNLEEVDAILVLGAGVWKDKPSYMLEDRLIAAINLYKEGVAPKIIMSGDHLHDNYNEVLIMKNYAIDAGVASEDIFMDHAGISTYDSIVRAKKIFGVKKMVVVTQEYHLYRSLYIASKFGIEAYGYDGIYKKYNGQIYRNLREILARNKDFIKCIFKPNPTYLGDAIPVSGNGDITND